MKTERETTRIVRSWLELGADRLPERVLDSVLDQLPATPQHRFRWWLVSAFPRPNNRVGLAFAAVVVVALVLGFGFLTQPNVGHGPSATETPRPSANPISMPGASWPLDPGIYSLPAFPLGITFEVPAGWHSCSDSLVEQSVCYTPADSVEDTRVAFVLVDNVVADPCSPGAEPLEPPVGPSVDDLVAAISGLEGFDATAPVDLTVDGYPGKGFILTTPRDPVCEMKTWVAADRTNRVFPGEVNPLEVLDVNGTRVVIVGAYYPGEPAGAELGSAVEKIIASVQISQ